MYSSSEQNDFFQNRKKLRKTMKIPFVLTAIALVLQTLAVPAVSLAKENEHKGGKPVETVEPAPSPVETSDPIISEPVIDPVDTTTVDTSVEPMLVEPTIEPVTENVVTEESVATTESTVQISQVDSQQASIPNDFSQCANDNGTAGECDWIYSILQANNSVYYEGMSTPQRLLFYDVTTNGEHTFTFSYQYTKGGTHAYDFITTVDPSTDTVQGNDAYEPGTDITDPCIDLQTADQAACEAAYSGEKTQIALPTDVFDSKDGLQSDIEAAYEAAFGDRFLTVFAQDGAFENPTIMLEHDPAGANSDTGDSTVYVTVTFTSTSCSEENPCEYLIFFGGHLASGSSDVVSGVNWGEGLGASQISGGPYHIKDISFDGQGGSQDNQIMASSILIPENGSITIIKDVVPNGAQDFAFTTTGTGLSNFSLDDDSDATLSNSTTFTGLASGSYSVTETGVSGYDLTSIVCTDPTTDSTVNLGTGTASIELDPNENITCTFTNTARGTIIVEKQTTPDGSSQTFTYTGDASGTISDGQQIVVNNLAPGTYTSTESDPGATFALQSIVCDDGSSTTASSGDVATRTATFNLDPGETVKCVFSNALQTGRIVVDKVTLPSGNTQSFSFTTTGSGYSNFSLTDAAAPNDQTVTVGSYTVTETVPTGWMQTSAVCDNGEAPDSIDVGAGEVITCTFTNELQPKLTVIKVVVNDNGGTKVVSDFPLFVDGNSVTSEVEGTYTVGSHVVSETTDPNYTSTISGDCDASGNVTLAAGDDKTCTITNNDVGPSLIVIKHVINDDGGTAVAGDFTMNVTGTNVSDDSFAGAEAPGTTVTLDAGSYSVAETGPSGYTSSLSADCTGTIALGETKTCTITNNDIAPQLIVIKNVVNDNGGTAVSADFTMNVTATNPSDTSFPGAVAPGTTITLDAGAYSVSETGPSGYASSFSTDCSGSIAVGETKTCTVTNNDIGPSLIVIKHVINDNGGTAVAGDFTMNVTGTNVSDASFPGVESPGTTVTLDAGSYSVSETGVTGYASSLSADCTGTIALGETKTCTITNNDIAPTLIVNKILNPTTDTGLFNLQIDGVTAGTGANVGHNGTTGAVSVNAGTHTVSETAGTGTDLADYASVIGGDCATNGSVTLALGETKTCTITNTRLGEITIIKDASPEGATDFTFTKNFGDMANFMLDDDSDPTLSNTIVFPGLMPGNAFTIGEMAMMGWDLESITCVLSGTTTTHSGSVVNGANVTITLAPGENVTCTFKNVRPAVTRTQGFWQTHTDFTTSIFENQLGGSLTIGTGGHQIIIDSPEELFGAFYASISKDSTGAKRTRLEQARMQLLQQLVAAELNCAAFGCSSSTLEMIADANEAYSGTSISAILEAAEELDAYNNSGDEGEMDPSLPSPGRATPKDSKALADIAFWDNP